MADYEKMYKDYGFTAKKYSHCYSPDQIGKELMRDFRRKGEVTYNSSSTSCKTTKNLVTSKSIED